MTVEILPCTLDTFMDNTSATSDFSGSMTLYIGRSRIYRALLRFGGLSDGTIPSNAVISSAVLGIYQTTDVSTVATDYRVFRQLRNWTSTACYSYYTSTTAWQTSGGFGAADCEQTDIGSRAMSDTEASNEYKEFSLSTSAITEIVNGTKANYGFMIKSDNETNTSYYVYSSQNAAANNPILTVTFTLPKPSGISVVDLSGYGIF